MDPPSTWEVAFRALAAKPPEFWRGRQRRTIRHGIIASLALVAVVVWVVQRGGSAGLGGMASVFLVAGFIGWYRFMGILRGAAESRVRDAMGQP